MKLLHFTDSHLQLKPTPAEQFHVQPFWMNGSGNPQVLFQRLARLVTQVDAIVFSGDATHGGGRSEAAKFFELLTNTAAGKPVFMVLGNHDVVNPAYRDHFYAQAQQYPNLITTDGIHPLGEIDLLLIQAGYVTANNSITTTWDANIFPVPAISDESLTQLGNALASNTTRPVVAVTHCPTHFLPPTATGFAPFVAPAMEQYRHRMHSLLDPHPRVRLVLAGHIHFNSTHQTGNGRIHQSLASFAEYPCQVRVIEISENRVESRLLNLADANETE